MELVKNSTIVEKLWDQVHDLEYRHEQARAESVDALKSIHDNLDFWKPGGPLKEKYGNWTTYVLKRFGYKKSQAYYLLDFSELRHNCIDHGIDPPEHESHTRAISQICRNAKRLGRDIDPVTVWSDVVNMAQGEEITVPLVERIMAETGRAGVRKKDADPIDVQELKRAIRTFYNCRALARMDGEAFKRKYGDVLDESKLSVIASWCVEYLESHVD